MKSALGIAADDGSFRVSSGREGRIRDHGQVAVQRPVQPLDAGEKEPDQLHRRDFPARHELAELDRRGKGEILRKHSGIVAAAGYRNITKSALWPMACRRP